MKNHNKLLAGCAAFVVELCLFVLVANMLDPAVIKHYHGNKMSDKDTGNRFELRMEVGRAGSIQLLTHENQYDLRGSWVDLIHVRY
jgi:hypothetical protein